MTPKAFVIGHPVAHSRSPAIHGHWLATHGIEGRYERIDVAPAALPEFLARFRERGFVGGNVTLPHKEEARRLVSGLTGRARRIGAVNTLVARPGGEVIGDNTDGVGFLDSLAEEVGPDWAEGVADALVIGAGGAARAIVTALLEAGTARIRVVNRSGERAAAIAGLAPDRIATLAWDEVAGALGPADLLVNTTSLGMTGQPALRLDLRALKLSAIVADIVYVPAATELMVEARARRLRTVGGLGMLLHQAVPGFEAWFGIRPRVTPELRAVIEADIERRA